MRLCSKKFSDRWGKVIDERILGLWTIHDKSVVMANSVIDFQNMQQIEKLRAQLGDRECRRLGFIVDDEKGVTALTIAGFGYLIFVEAAGVTSLPEAFAAGYQCAAEFCSDQNEGFNHV